MTGKFYRPRLTLKSVNAELERRGIAERLFKGPGYFYFDEGNASRWRSSSVMTARLNSLSLDQWVSEHATLKAENEATA